MVLLWSKLTLKRPLISVEPFFHELFHICLWTVGLYAVSTLCWIWLPGDFRNNFDVLHRGCDCHASLTRSKRLGSLDKSHSLFIFSGLLSLWIDTNWALADVNWWVLTLIDRSFVLSLLPTHRTMSFSFSVSLLIFPENWWASRWDIGLQWGILHSFRMKHWLRISLVPVLAMA